MMAALYPYTTRTPTTGRRRPRYDEDLKDLYEVMLRQERTTYAFVPIKKNNKTSSSSSSSSSSTTLWQRKRSAIVPWIYRVVDMFDLIPQVAGTAIYYINQTHESLVGNKASSSDFEFNLLALTSLYVAIKVHDPKLLPITELIKIGNNSILLCCCSSSKQKNDNKRQITVDDVIQMELRLMEYLDYYLHPPTIECFVLAFGELLPTTELFQNDAIQLVRQVVQIQDLQHLPNSVLAYACLIMAMTSADASPFVDDIIDNFEWDMSNLTNLKPNTPGVMMTCDALLDDASCVGRSEQDGTASSAAAAQQRDGTCTSSSSSDDNAASSPSLVRPRSPKSTIIDVVDLGDIVIKSSVNNNQEGRTTETIFIVEDLDGGFEVSFH